jgi:hypothetical protein
VARYKLRVGRRINSATPVADAKHSWLDALSYAGMLAGLILVAFGWRYGDQAVTARTPPAKLPRPRSSALHAPVMRVGLPPTPALLPKPAEETADAARPVDTTHTNRHAHQRT